MQLKGLKDEKFSCAILIGLILFMPLGENVIVRISSFSY